MSETILAPNFLFRFSAPCRTHRSIWTKTGVKLSATHTLPCFAELQGNTLFAELRAAWSDKGLSFALQVRQKKQAAWCRSTRIEDSDGLHIWIDTRDTHNIHRASRFCHHFAFLPSGGGAGKQSPVARLLPINRARENPKPVADKALGVRSKPTSDGYQMQAHIPATALTGFDPSEHRRVGFFYAVNDRELGWQTFSIGTEFPFAEDPSLWGTLELVD